jgi:fatty-acid peroxygenase
MWKEPVSLTTIPRDRAFDSTLALLADGYTFISKRCRALRSDVFQTRLMFRKAVCVLGAEAAAMFYHPGRFTRRGAMPPTALMLLQDRGSVQQLDGDDHRGRKALFMAMTTPDGIRPLVDAAAAEWRERIGRWQRAQHVVLHDEVQGILCRAVCAWAGIPLTEAEARKRTRELAAMIDGAGSFGPRNWRGLLLRMRTERWLRRVVRRVRADQLGVPADSAAQRIAWHREGAGRLLPPKVAAVELLNVLRPTVAVAWYVTFAALALHQFPAYRHRLASAGDDELVECFVHEVRRVYPFFPLVAGRARHAFTWRSRRFAPGTWVILDLYGTNRDARSWTDPDAFRPERFRGWRGDPFTLIPQGGGSYHRDHRRAGEAITIELMKMAVRMLSRAMHYEVPDQDLRVDLSRIPTLPASRFVIASVKAAAWPGERPSAAAS